MKGLNTWFAVGLGGVIGAMGRYALAIDFPLSNFFPIATLIVNLVGCFLLSFILFSSFSQRNTRPWLLTGLTTGVIGSFTTFSTIIIELHDLSKRSIVVMTLYLLISFFGGLLFCYFGYKVARSGDQHD